MHRAIWKEKGLLNSQGKHIERAEEMLKLLEAVQLPKKMAIMHNRAHQKVSSESEKAGGQRGKTNAKQKVKTESALVLGGQVFFKR